MRSPVIPVARELQHPVIIFCSPCYGRNARAVPTVAPPLGSPVPRELDRSAGNMPPEISDGSPYHFIQPNGIPISDHKKFYILI